MKRSNRYTTPFSATATAVPLGSIEGPAALRRWILFFSITLGFMARMATFQVPLLDHHAWRQADGATIARNFARAVLFKDAIYVVGGSTSYGSSHASRGAGIVERLKTP